MLFGMQHQNGDFANSHSVLEAEAGELGLEVVPLLASGNVAVTDLPDLLESESLLGGVKIEGVVVKNFREWYWAAADKTYHVMCGKYVADRFKEQHSQEWRSTHTSKGNWESYRDSFRAIPRWEKAVQHLRENGELVDAPEDIGKVMKEIHRDINEEDKEAVLQKLWQFFGSDLIRKATAGFPEWYKDRLLDRYSDDS